MVKYRIKKITKQNGETEIEYDLFLVEKPLIFDIVEPDEEPLYLSYENKNEFIKINDNGIKLYYYQIKEKLISKIVIFNKKMNNKKIKDVLDIECENIEKELIKNKIIKSFKSLFKR